MSNDRELTTADMEKAVVVNRLSEIIMVFITVVLSFLW